jgi:hypothetical protein
VLRLHCTAGKIRFPWVFGPQAEQASFEAIRFRYRLIPTLYSAVHRASLDGTPLLRRLDLEWPTYEEATSSRQYLLGDDLLISPVTESDGPQYRPLTGTFRGEYFPNKDLSGTPVLTRDDAKIDFDWGQRSPSGDLPNDAFSVRWTGKIGPLPRTAEYRFATSTDDGVRLWIGDKQVIDQWKPLDSSLNSGTVRLEAGKTYDIRMEYFESGGGANAHLLWTGAEPPRTGPMPWSFWVPPGAWIDAWTGDRIVGPKKVSMPTSLRRFPVLVRDGAVLFLGEDRVKNADEQLRKPITIEAYPGPLVTRKLVEDDGISVDAPKTTRQVTAVRTDKSAFVKIGPSTADRDLVVRVHLRPGETPKAVTLGGTATPYRLEKPQGTAAGLGSLFTARGGPVVEVRLPKWPSGFSTAVEVRTK